MTTTAAASGARIGEETQSAERNGQAEWEEAGIALQAFPNTFSDRVTLTFTVAQTEPATLAVYDLQGKLVATLYDAEAEAGKAYSFEFSAGSHPAVMYLSRLATASEASHQKIVLVR